MHHDEVAALPIVEEVLGVDRPGLILEREPKALQIIHDPPRSRKWVGTEGVRQELDDLSLASE